MKPSRDQHRLALQLQILSLRQSCNTQGDEQAAMVLPARVRKPLCKKIDQDANFARYVLARRAHHENADVG